MKPTNALGGVASRRGFRFSSGRFAAYIVALFCHCVRVMIRLVTAPRLPSAKLQVAVDFVVDMWIPSLHAQGV